MSEATGLEFAIHRDADGRYRWRLQSANGRVLATGAVAAYSSEGATRRAIELVRQGFATAAVTVVGADFAPAEGLR